MAYRSAVFFTILCVLLMLAACDGPPANIFPDFLTQVMLTRSVGDIFTDPSSKFFFYVLPSLDTLSHPNIKIDDWIVIVQELNDNRRKVAVFDSQFKRIWLKPEIDEKYGAMHGAYDDLAFIGCNLINRRPTPSPTVSASLENIALRDKVMALGSVGGYIFIDETYNNNKDETEISYINITSINPITTALPTTTPIPGGPYKVEAAFETIGTTFNFQIFCNSQTENVLILGNNLSISYYFNRSFAPGSFHYIPENKFAAQTLKGDWEIYEYKNYLYNEYYEQILNATLKIDPSCFFAFTKNDYVYIFSPTSRQLFKCWDIINYE